MVTDKSGKALWRRAAAVLMAWLMMLLAGSPSVLNGGEMLPPLNFDGSSTASDGHTDAAAADTSPSREHARSNLSVFSAFRGAVARPAKSTTRIFCEQRQVALGVIVDSDGLIATKASELKGATVCELSDGTRHKAELVGVDRGSDLALLKISARGLPAIVWSQEDPPAVGGWVITPGLGELPQAIGVVSVAPHHVRGGVLGIQMTEDKPGPRITFVVPESGAAVAGLVRGDVITHVNGQPMEDSNAVVAMTSNALPGEKIGLTVLRGRDELKLSATLGSVATTLSSQRARFQDQLGGPLSQRRVLFPAALEHDSVLAPNECGGALVNLDGEAIGINIARASRIASYAIPASVARPILDQLKSHSIAAAATVPVATGAHPPQLSAAQRGQ
jgi:serine protease Do